MKWEIFVKDSYPLEEILEFYANGYIKEIGQFDFDHYYETGKSRALKCINTQREDMIRLLKECMLVAHKGSFVNDKMSQAVAFEKTAVLINDKMLVAHNRHMMKEAWKP